MSEEAKSTSKNKLAQAMQDAAIESIGEDINEICASIEKITNDLPKHVKEQLSSLKGDIESLEGALKSVPEQFDVDFSRKMNRILDTAMEIDAHSRALRIDVDTHSQQITNALTTETPDKIVRGVVTSLNEKIDGYHAASTWTLLMYGFLCALTGGVVGGAMFVMYVRLFA
ncbi:hypothetical protein AB4396_06940 [Vibrio cyclitrophicus]